MAKRAQTDKPPRPRKAPASARPTRARSSAVPPPDAPTPEPTSSRLGSIEHLADVIRRTPNIAGQFDIPSFSERKNAWQVGISVDDAKRSRVTRLLDHYPAGQHVVALFVPINTSTDAAIWEALNNGDPLPTGRESDFAREFEVTTKFMADALGMSDRNLQLLSHKGVAVKVARGRWDLVETFKRRLRQIESEAKGSSLAVRIASAEQELETKRVKHLKEVKELVSFAEVKALAHETARNYKRALEAIPSRLGSELAAAKTMPEVRRLLMAEIKSIEDRLGLSEVADAGDNHRPRKRR